MKEIMHDPQMQPYLEGCLVRVVVWSVIVGILIIFVLGVFMGIVLGGTY